MRQKLAIISFISFISFGCGSGQDASQPPQSTVSAAASLAELPFDGSFAGTLSGTQSYNPGDYYPLSFSGSALFTVSQVGDTVTGNWTAVNGRSFGSLVGTVSGSTVSLTILDGSGSRCFPGNYTGQATISGKNLTGNYTGTSACGAVSAGFVATKQ